jgi:hypothetical protein
VAVISERDELVRWLLAGDPAIRWQVMHDLLHESPEAFEAERENVARDGWGARLLALQAVDGRWGNSLYNGKWISTTYSLYLLKLLGLTPRHPQALLGCSRLMEGGLYKGCEIRFSRLQEHADFGVTALVLSICSYFGWQIEELAPIAGRLLDRQRPDGSWRPNDSHAAALFEFETTLLVLESLTQYERAPGAHTLQVGAARQQGWRFLFERELGFESGKPVKPGWASFWFPPYWFYDCLAVLDCLRDSRGDRDPGAREALDVVRARRRRDGRWGRGGKHAGRTHFDMEAAGQPSRWNTLRALRVLDWWNDSSSASA